MNIVGIFNQVKTLIKNYSFEMLLIASVIFILGLALYKYMSGEKGTWNTTAYYYVNKEKKSPSPPRDSKGEIRCRNYLEKRFNRSFSKARPDFMNNPVTGGNFNLELDCYNKELKLAVEYNGRQHYEYTPFFHKNKEAFLNQKYRDDMKRRICKDMGIRLIEVHYTENDIEGYLEKELRRLGIN